MTKFESNVSKLPGISENYMFHVLCQQTLLVLNKPILNFSQFPYSLLPSHVAQLERLAFSVKLAVAFLYI